MVQFNTSNPPPYAQSTATSATQQAGAPTPGQLQSAGAQAGIDFYLNQGAQADVSSWTAQTRGSLLQLGYSTQQIDLYIDTATRAYNAAITRDQGASAAASGAAGGTAATGGATASGAGLGTGATSGGYGGTQSYQDFVHAVGNDVLPAGSNLEPQPLGNPAGFSAQDDQFGNYGGQLGSSLPLNTNLPQRIATEVDGLRRNGATNHQIAVFVRALESAYNTRLASAAPASTSSAAGTTAGAAGTTAGAAGATSSGPAVAAGPNLTAQVSQDFQNWYSGAQGSNTYSPSIDDWRKLVNYASGLKTSDPAQYQALVRQLNATHSDWGAALTQAVDLSAQDPGRVDASFRLGRANSTSNYANITQNTFADTANDLLTLRRQSGDQAYNEAINRILDPNLRNALRSSVDRQWSASSATGGTAATHRTFENDYNRVHNRQGGWINGGNG